MSNPYDPEVEYVAVTIDASDFVACLQRIYGDLDVEQLVFHWVTQEID